MSRTVVTGVVWMLVTTFFFVCVHATGKLLVATYPLVQVVWGRYAFHLLIAALILGPRLPRVARTTNLRLQLLRSGFIRPRMPPAGCTNVTSRPRSHPEPGPSDNRA